VASSTMTDVKTAVRADPGPLGLCGFALTTFVLSIVNAGWLSGADDIKVVIGLAVFYGGTAQLLAGMWEFRNGNTFGATAFSSYGAFWLSFAALLIPGFGISFGAKGGPANAAVGVYLLGWAIFTAIMLVGTLRLNGGLVAVFGLLTLTFLLLAIGYMNGSSGLHRAGGIFGILTALAAWYVAAAGVLSSVSGGRIALPLYPLARA
jgi:uncharacterized protein